MCNVIDGKCDLANRYPDNFYHNNPSLYYQIDGEIIEFQSSMRRLKDSDPKYGYKIHAIRARTVKRVIEICKRMADKDIANGWWNEVDNGQPQFRNL